MRAGGILGALLDDLGTDNLVHDRLLRRDPRDINAGGRITTG
jgi:hypothetical protein